MEPLSSVNNAMRILRELMNEGNELGIKELGLRLGLAKSTVYRLVRTLCLQQFVQQNQMTGKYYLGISSFELGFAAYHTMDIREIAFPLLSKLMNSLRKEVKLGVFSLGGVIYVCSRIPEHLDSNISKTGRRTPTHCTALGKVLLANQKQEEIEQALVDGLKAYTNKTNTNKDTLFRELADIRQKGYGFTYEEYIEGRWAVAVPVYNDSDQVIAAISLSDNVGLFSQEKKKQYITELQTYSRLITGCYDRRLASKI